VQCLQRRISTVTGNAAELDEIQGYEADFLTAPREDGIDRAMAVGTVSLALDCAAMSDRQFMSRFAGPMSWVLMPFPTTERHQAAAMSIALFRRYGTSVRDLLIEATKPALEDLVDQTLAPESLLSLVLASRLSAPSLPQMELVPEAPPEKAQDDAPATETFEGIVIAVDEVRHRIWIKDLTVLVGAAIYPVMRLLIAVSLKERSKPGRPDQYRGLSAKTIATELGPSDETAVRSAIKRARDELAESYKGLGLSFDRNAVIEGRGGGYRLNPKVTVVTFEELRRG
jgi:hypothetical protein